MRKQNNDSLGNFVAWWAMARADAIELMDDIKDGEVEIFRNGKDMSEETLVALRKIADNMETFIAMAKRIGEP